MKCECNCDDARELMPDLAAGLTAPTPEVKAHLDSCAECAGKLEAFRQTMSLLDEWQAPEPSPYFDVRLNARLREEMESAKQPAGWLRWLRKPVLAVSFALLMAASVTLVRMNYGNNSSGGSSSAPPVAAALQVAAEPGTAVGDLQALDKNQNLYSDFDVLDDLQVQQDVTANP
ncbi:MAG: zf-HC2 domain-containing protein [Terriglobales bacterium]|jgi:anti-sigma factor RsiW|nr:zf-HC2 domain-containing protein [Terriglobales bacterium]